MNRDRAFKILALSVVNEHILDAARESVADELDWEFFCECGRSGCQEHVLLSVERYIALHDGGEAVLAPGHRLSQTARARTLRSDAKALRGQAKHQVRRAKQNLSES
jgi:hypothetical protein